MGGPQAANVMSTLKKDQASLNDEELNNDEIKKIEKPILDKYEKEGNPYYASARLWDDGIISPAETRQTLILALQAIQNSPIEKTNFPVFRM